MTPPAIDQALLDDAVELAREAGDFTMRYFESGDLAVDYKGDGSPVTQADRGAESLLRARLAERYPDDAIVGEEHEDQPGTSGRTWMLDPVDGTKSFTHGVPLFANLVAVLDEHGPAVGVLNLPALGEIVYAGRGLGCFHNGRPIQVNEVADIGRSAICASGFEGVDPEPFARLCASGAIVRTWGDAYGYFLVATGRVEAMIDYGLNPWDIAPMHVIIGEAGGRISDWDAQPLPMSGNTLTTNGLVHDHILGLL